MGLYWNLTNTNCGIRGSHGDLMGYIHIYIPNNMMDGFV